MDIQQLINRINDYSRMLTNGTLMDIERDILLDDLRSLYKHVRDFREPYEQVSPPPAAETVVTPPVVVRQVSAPEPPAPVREEIKMPASTEKPVEPVTLKAEPIPVPIAEPAKKEQAKQKTNSLNEIFAGEEKSLNSRLSGDKKPALNDQAGGRDLKSLIDFNKQYVMTNELFGGDSRAFQAAVTHINDSPTLEAAFEFIKTDLLPIYKWSGEMQSARLFDKLVRQKFGF